VAWSEGRFMWVDQGCSKQLAARIKHLIDVRVASWSIHSLVSFNKVSEAHQMKCKSQCVSLLQCLKVTLQRIKDTRGQLSLAKS
jgi:hypothetical protein